MKKHLLFACLLLICTLLLSCGRAAPVKIDGDYAVITISEERIEQGTTLKEYMDLLVADGTLEYEIDNGMITSIGGVLAGDGKYWILFTDDPDYSVTAWGECMYGDVVYGSASLGAESILVKAGCTYIWHLQEM